MENFPWAKTQCRVVAKQLDELNTIVGTSLYTYSEGLYLQAIEADYLAAEQLEQTLSSIRDIELVATNARDTVWEAEGAIPQWHSMKEMMDPFRQVVSILTQLWDLTVSDPFHTQDLENARKERSLVYQSL